MTTIRDCELWALIRLASEPEGTRIDSDWGYLDRPVALGLVSRDPDAGTYTITDAGRALVAAYAEEC